jgi:hypothetical protein
MILDLHRIKFYTMDAFDLLPHKVGLLLPLKAFLFLLGHFLSVEIKLRL